MKHIGLDVHSTTTDACVRNAVGKIVLRRTIRTTAEELVNFMSSVKGAKRVVLEESQLADWVTRLLERHCSEVIRSQPRHNRLISESEDKCDRTDAESLSDLLYMNRLKSVHHPPEVYRSLREGVRAYWIASGELTRTKNRFKGFLLFNGWHEVGRSVYSLRHREAALKRVRSLRANVELARLHYAQVDQAREMKARHIRLLRELARPLRTEAGHLMTVPAIGPISAYTLLAYLETGRRLRNKRQLWRYSGLGIRRHESSGSGTQGASYSGSRLLKRVLMSAAITVVNRKEQNALTERWEAWIRDGVDPKRARRNLARKIAVIAHCVLRTGKDYRDGLVRATA